MSPRGVGNVRELKHVLESMISLSQEELLHFRQLPVYLHGKLDSVRGFEKEKARLDRAGSDTAWHLESENYDLRSAVERVERDMILKALARAKGNKTKAGELLGIPRQTLKYKMDRLRIEDVE